MAKHILFLVIDGMAEKPLKQLSGRTPLEIAKKPNLDILASYGTCGLLQVLPFAPESDEAMFSLLGLDMSKFPGRGILGWYGSGKKPLKNAVYLRVNIVKVNKHDPHIVDDVEASLPNKQLERFIRDINKINLPQSFRKLGIKHRLIHTVGHRAVLEITSNKIKLSDNITNTHPSYKIILGKLTKALPRPKWKILKIRKARPLNNTKNAKLTAGVVNFVVNSSINMVKGYAIVTRGAGSKLPKLEKSYNGWLAVSKMPIEVAIGKLVGMKTKWLKTKHTKSLKYYYENLADQIGSYLNRYNVYFQIKGPGVLGPDTRAHNGDPIGKAKAISQIDKYFIEPLLYKLKNKDTAIVITADHSTSSILRSHIDAPVPWMIVDLSKKKQPIKQMKWNEKTCRKGKRLKDGQLVKLVKQKVKIKTNKK